MQAARRVSEHCLNCGRRLDSQFCPDCGQENTDHNASLRELLPDVVGEFVKFDSKLWATLRPLLLRPGFLTREYLAGRRVRYVPPFRLYFIVSATILLLYAYGNVDHDIERHIGGGAAAARASGTQARPAPEHERQAARQRYVTERVRRGFRWYWANYGTVLLALLPLTALLLKLRYLRAPHHFIAHLVFSLHFQCVLLLLTLPGVLLHQLDLNLWLHLTLLTLYGYLAARAVYGQGPVRSLFTAVLLVALPLFYQGWVMATAISMQFRS